MAAEIKNAAISKDFVWGAVTRTLKFRIEEINQKSNDIYENMKYFERKYGMKTEEFYKKFIFRKNNSGFTLNRLNNNTGCAIINSIQ